jgi:hypothetical protein
MWRGLIALDGEQTWNDAPQAIFLKADPRAGRPRKVTVPQISSYSLARLSQGVKSGLGLGFLRRGSDCSATHGCLARQTAPESVQQHTAGVVALRNLPRTHERVGLKV